MGLLTEFLYTSSEYTAHRREILAMLAVRAGSTGPRHRLRARVPFGGARWSSRKFLVQR